MQVWCYDSRLQPPSVPRFIAAVWKHWEARFGTTVVLIIAIVQAAAMAIWGERVPGWIRVIPQQVWLLVAILMFCWSCYFVWRDERMSAIAVTGDMQKQLDDRSPRVRIVRWDYPAVSDEVHTPWDRGLWLHNDGKETAYSVNIRDVEIKVDNGPATVTGMVAQAIAPGGDGFLPVFLSGSPRYLSNLYENLKGRQEPTELDLLLEYKDWKQVEYTVATKMRVPPLYPEESSFEVLGPI